MDEVSRELDRLSQSPLNGRVLAYLSDKSAHSDVAHDLLVAVKPLGDVQTFCPDWSQYRYVAVSTSGVIFGFAVGMNEVGFRVGSLIDRAVATGAERLTEVGDDWAKFVLHGPDWPRVDLSFWARKAHLLARETSTGELPKSM